jgi:response regulator RpfG family c-di-GMP phosphodiesterase
MADKGKILLVDDDEGILASLSDFLNLEGFEVETINDGQKAINLIGNNHYDLIISDIKMPVVSGIGVLKAAKEMDKYTPVIMITGYASVDTAIEALRQGAYDYLSKPFDMDRFVMIVERAIRQKKLAEKNKELTENLSSLNKQLEEKIKHIFALKEVSRAISYISDLESILGAIVNVCKEITKAGKVAFLLLDERSKELLIEIAVGIDSEIIKTLRIKEGEGVIGWASNIKRPITHAETKRRNILLSNKDYEVFGDGEFLCYPVVYQNKLFGLLTIGSLPDGRNLAEDDFRVLSILASQASIAINNFFLYERLQNTYLNTLFVLSSALEAKCKNTKGHSLRVSKYATDFAKYLGMMEKEIQILERACGIHDIGKIVIPDSILSKPAKLTEEEMNQMRMHPTKGVEILIPLGILKELIPIVRYHHERYDGKGYPDSLKTEEIPLSARLVAIVDAFDAMTSYRSYRLPYSKEKALKEIEENLGSQFDPVLGKKFLQSSSSISPVGNSITS